MAVPVSLSAAASTAGSEALEGEQGCGAPREPPERIIGGVWTAIGREKAVLDGAMARSKATYAAPPPGAVAETLWR